MSWAIRFDRVSKCYRLGVGRRSFRETIAEAAVPLFQRDSVKRRDRMLWALQDVSFDVASGEVVGIIGPNGAGKTTILRLLSHITRPTAGQIDVNGRLSALIELGAGFHPDLTGRENIYLNGAILGLSQREIDKNFDSIVEFSGLKRFMDTPVKRYSSGMYARLGFAIAIHVDPDILLVDEVLAVGDQAFQVKCLERMREFRRNARAVVFVSHNLVAVRELCDRAIWLSDGVVRAIDKTEKVIETYRMDMFWQRSVGVSDLDPSELAADTGVRVTGVHILGERGEECSDFRTGEPLVVRIAYTASRRIQTPTFALAIWRQDGLKCGEASNLYDNINLGPVVGQGMVQFRCDDPRLMPGRYYVNVAISDRYLVRYDHVAQAGQFTVTSSEASTLGMPGPFRFPGQWCQVMVKESDELQRRSEL